MTANVGIYRYIYTQFTYHSKYIESKGFFIFLVNQNRELDFDTEMGQISNFLIRDMNQIIQELKDVALRYLI